jgi:hypothetical protein
MASRQAVLLTPLESFRTRPLPTRHRINRVHPRFLQKTTFVFSCACRMPFPQLLSFVIHQWDGAYPPSRQRSCSIFGQWRGLSIPLSLLDATLTRRTISVHSKGLTGNLTPLDATLTKNRGEGGTSFRPKHYLCSPCLAILRSVPQDIATFRRSDLWTFGRVSEISPVPNRTADCTLLRIYSPCAILPSLRSGNRPVLPRWRSL